MKKTRAFLSLVSLLLLPLFLASCDINVDFTHSPYVRGAIGRPVTNKLPLSLYTPLKRIGRYGNTYYLDYQDGVTESDVKGDTGPASLIAIIPPGQSFIFTKADRVTSFGKEEYYLWSTLDYKGRKYPVIYGGDYLGEDSLKDDLNVVFGVPK